MNQSLNLNDYLPNARIEGLRSAFQSVVVECTINVTS